MPRTDEKPRNFNASRDEQLFELDGGDGLFGDVPEDAVDAGNGFDGFERLPAWEMLWQIIQRDSRYAT